MELEEFGSHILLTNFDQYVRAFAKRFNCEIRGEGKPMQAATNSEGLTMINFGIGSANVATIMDLLTAVNPDGVLFLGKCGGLKESTEIGHFILPIAAILMRAPVSITLRSASATFVYGSCTSSCPRS